MTELDAINVGRFLEEYFVLCKKYGFDVHTQSGAIPIIEKMPEDVKAFGFDFDNNKYYVEYLR